MKKSLRKLSLNRETLRALQGSEAGNALGGSRPTSVACVEVTGCCDSQGGPECYPYTACLGTCSWSVYPCD